MGVRLSANVLYSMTLNKPAFVPERSYGQLNDVINPSIHHANKLSCVLISTVGIFMGAALARDLV